MPYFEPALDLVCLVNSFFHHRGGLQQYSNTLQTLRDLDDELDIIDVMLRQVAVAQVDAALVVDVIGGHVIGSDKVVDALTGATYGGDDVVAGLHFGDIRPDSFHLSETFVADDEKVVSGRCCAVFRSIDLLVGTIDADAENFYQDSAAVWNLIHRWLWQIGDVDAVGLSREYADGFHFDFSYEC